MPSTINLKHGRKPGIIAGTKKFIIIWVANDATAAPSTPKTGIRAKLSPTFNTAPIRVVI